MERKPSIFDRILFYWIIAMEWFREHSGYAVVFGLACIFLTYPALKETWEQFVLTVNGHRPAELIHLDYSGVLVFLGMTAVFGLAGFLLLRRAFRRNRESISHGSAGWGDPRKMESLAVPLYWPIPPASFCLGEARTSPFYRVVLPPKLTL